MEYKLNDPRLNIVQLYKVDLYSTVDNINSEVEYFNGNVEMNLDIIVFTLWAIYIWYK